MRTEPFLRDHAQLDRVEALFAGQHVADDDEVIARYRAFYDVNDLARQLAIAPAPGSRAEKAMVRLQRLQERMRNRRGE